MTAVVHCQNLHKSFDRFPAVAGASLEIPAGEILALVGPSGCGKTTTLRLIAGFEQLDRGRITIAGQLVDDGRSRVPPERRRAGMVFQDYAIFPHLSVGDNLAFGLAGGRRQQQLSGSQAARVTEMMRFVGLQGLDARMPHELSGGQQQRVALARALAPEPVVLLMDEPFSNLDAALRIDVRAEVRQLLKQRGVTALFVTHDQEEALFMGDRVAVMNAGTVEQVGAPEAVFHQPRTRFVAEFLGHADFVPGEVTGQGVATALGTLRQRLALPTGTQVDIAIRPDDIAVEPATDGNGRILDRQFIGIAYIYRVQLADGSLVHSWQPHTVQVAVGTAVRASFRHEHLFACFHGGQTVPVLAD